MISFILGCVFGGAVVSVLYSNQIEQLYQIIDKLEREKIMR